MRTINGYGATLNGLDLTGTDEYGVSWKSEVTNWQTMAGTTGQTFQNENSDGGWIDQAFHQPLSLRLIGRVFAPDRKAAEAAITRLQSKIPVRTLAALAVSSDGDVRHRMVRMEGVPQFPVNSDQHITFDVQLSSPGHRKLAGDGSSRYVNSQPVGLPFTSGGLQLPGAAPLLKNLVPRPGAEYAFSPVALGSVTVARSTAWKDTGSSSWELTRTSDASTDGAMSVEPNWSSLKPNTQYTVYGKCYLPAPLGSAAVGATGSVLNQKLSIFVHINSTTVGIFTGVNVAGEQRMGGVFTTPPVVGGFSTMRAYGGGSPGNKTYWDSLILVEGNYPDLEFFDGDSVNTSSRTFAWDGAPGNSLSTMSSTGGLQVPFQIVATVVSGSVTLTNGGNARPPVLVTFTGPVTNPVLRSSDGGVMRFNIVLSAGQQLAVDLDAKTVKLNGVNRRNALVGSWIVPAAGMELRFDADSYNPDALMTVQWSDAWR